MASCEIAVTPDSKGLRVPKAGWCDQCDEWVWVADDGSCQHGHDAGHVTSVYDADPQSEGDPGKPVSPDRRPPTQMMDELQAHRPEGGWFGVGDPPADIRRFNWGAYLLPEFWPFFNGMPEVGLAYWGLVFGAVAFTFAVPDTGGAVSVLLLVPQLLIIVLTVAFAAVADVMRWVRQSRALDAGQPREVFTLVQYRQSQRRWLLAGWLVTGLSLAVVAAPAVIEGMDRELSIAFGTFAVRMIAAVIVATRMAGTDTQSAS